MTVKRKASSGPSHSSKERITTEQYRQELNKENQKIRYRRTLLSTLSILIVVAAIAVLLSMLLFPVLQVTGTSMEPTLENGEILLAVKYGRVERGDVVAFYYNNKVLLKRVIGVAGDQIDILENGDVLVNGQTLDEPYVAEKSLGQADLDFPYQVPDSKIFVMGDHRNTSVDSRNSEIGAIAEEFIIGKVIFVVWPFNQFGFFSTE